MFSGSSNLIASEYKHSWCSSLCYSILSSPSVNSVPVESDQHRHPVSLLNDQASSSLCGAHLSAGAFLVPYIMRQLRGIRSFHSSTHKPSSQLATMSTTPHKRAPADIITYSLNKQMVYITPGETYEVRHLYIAAGRGRNTNCRSIYPTTASS